MHPSEITFYLHIGLPKTASTYWKSNVFPRIPDIALMQREPPTVIEPAVATLLKMYCQAPTEKKCKKRMKKSLDEVVSARDKAIANGHADILISNVSISVDAQGFWSETTQAPQTVIDRLAQLQKALGDPTFKIIFGTRAPDQWIPSRYAESAKLDPSFRQADFEPACKSYAPPRNCLRPHSGWNSTT